MPATVTRCFFVFQAEDGIRDLVRSRGLGDVYKRQAGNIALQPGPGGVSYAFLTLPLALLVLTYIVVKLSLIHI